MGVLGLEFGIHALRCGVFLGGEGQCNWHRGTQHTRVCSSEPPPSAPTGCNAPRVHAEARGGGGSREWGWARWGGKMRFQARTPRPGPSGKTIPLAPVPCRALPFFAFILTPPPTPHTSPPPLLGPASPPPHGPPPPAPQRRTNSTGGPPCRYKSEGCVKVFFAPG